MRRPASFALALAFLAGASGPAQANTAKTFDPPGRTAWKPDGCRSVPADDPVIGTHGLWRFLHGDVAASDEISIAAAPVVEADWHAEENTFHVTVPVFDRSGNLYLIPYLPYENVALVSLDPDDGSRRWAIGGTGAPVGACAPITLDDPDNPGEEMVYVTLKDRAFAVHTDGTIAWDVPTGLTLAGANTLDSTSGNTYLPQRDAIVGLTTGGEMYLVDRKTGVQLLDAPFLLPGEPSPEGAGIPLTPGMIAQAEAELGQFINFPPSSTFMDFLQAILGNGIEVSNSFASDANTGRMWVAATAPDAEDGTVDGVSELGALYGLDVVDGVGGPEIQIACRRDFVGGSASTPAVRSDGTRVYVADNDGNVLALDSSCNLLWSVDVGSQVTGSIAVASDNDEIYASTREDIIKIIDNGASGTIAWTADLEVYTPSNPSWENFNTLLAGIAANGINFMAGVGVPPGQLGNLALPVDVGYGVLDRDTGKVRSFADGLDESVAELNVGPDGAYYNGNSPVRRAFSRILVPGVAPLEGGIRKFKPRRVDLLVRDALCAAADRAVNAAANAMACPASALADGEQIDDLLAQVLRSGPVAVDAGDMTAAKWARVADLAAEARTANLATQATLLPRACAVTAPCDETPRSGCLAATSSKLSMKRKVGADPNVDSFSWSWSKGAPFGDAEIGSPSVDADYGVCLYTDADASPRLIHDSGVAAGPEWNTKMEGRASWKPTAGTEEGLRKLQLRGSAEAGKTSVKAQAKGVQWPSGTFLVDAPVVVQLVNLETGECWGSRFEAADVTKSDGTNFKAEDSQ